MLLGNFSVCHNSLTSQTVMRSHATKEDTQQSITTKIQSISRTIYQRESDTQLFYLYFKRQRERERDKHHHHLNIKPKILPSVFFLLAFYLSC